MHARPTPTTLAVSVGLNRLVLLLFVFLFALAMGSLAVQGSGPRTVQFNFPDAANVQTGPGPTVLPAVR